MSGFAFAQSARVTGKVTGPDNQGLPGVNVQVSGTTVGTASDADGNFSINAASNASLVFSNIGYISQTVPINGRSVVTVQLAEDQKTLNEVVVVGYGTQRKTDVTGALTAISTKEFAQQPVTRLDQVLQGRAAGVQVSQTNGAPGGDARIRIRGANSVLGNNNPLYVVDGFVGADFNFVNPSDIETIQILKDAASTSIYGSRGANGVVIITTKKGSKGLKVNYEASSARRKLSKNTTYYQQENLPKSSMPALPLRAPICHSRPIRSRSSNKMAVPTGRVWYSATEPVNNTRSRCRVVATKRLFWCRETT